MKLRTCIVVTTFMGGGLTVQSCPADEPRAKPPTFSAADTEGIFYGQLSEAFRGQRPTLAGIRQSNQAAATVTKTTAASSDPGEPQEVSGWAKLISPTSLEDEIKRVKLQFDQTVSTPGAFKSGGYQDARLQLSILSVMFAVISDYSGDVRWKNHAATARDLISRTAFNCKAGSTQVYNEAKLRKGDLQDLVSGGGLAARDAAAENEWDAIVDRSPMMEYAEVLLEQLEDVTNNAAAVKNNPEDVRRMAELFAVLGQVLIQEGLDDYDDTDYVALSQKMTDAGRETLLALERGDADGVRKGVGAISQSCTLCHDQYR